MSIMYIAQSNNAMHSLFSVLYIFFYRPIQQIPTTDQIDAVLQSLNQVVLMEKEASLYPLISACLACGITALGKYGYIVIVVVL